MKYRNFYSCLLAVCLCGAAGCLSASAEDNIKVVKGQVSDYYIPVVEQHEIKGRVTDMAGNPLEGATVMSSAVKPRPAK